MPPFQKTFQKPSWWTFQRRPWQWFPPRNPSDRPQFINDAIKAFKVIVIDEEGTNLGQFSRDEALRMAYEQEKDLVQIAYNPTEMVCTAKITDYWRYIYNKQREDKEKKKTQKTNTTKEIKVGYTIGSNDLLLKVNHAKEFLADGHFVRFFVKLRGREKAFSAIMLEKFKHIEAQLADFGRSQGIKTEANGYSMILSGKSK